MVAVKDDPLIMQAALDAKKDDKEAFKQDVKAILHRDTDLSNPLNSIFRLKDDAQALEKAGVPHSSDVLSNNGADVRSSESVRPGNGVSTDDRTEQYIKRDDAGRIVHTQTGYDISYDKDGNIEKIATHKKWLFKDDGYYRNKDGSWYYHYGSTAVDVGYADDLAGPPQLNQSTGELTIRTPHGFTTQHHADGSWLAKNDKGQVVQGGRSSDRINFSFSYDKQGHLTELDHGPTEWLRQSDGTWLESDHDKKLTGRKLRDIKVDSDGTVTETDMSGAQHVLRIERHETST